MGRLYTKYYNTLKRMRVRDIHQDFTQESTLMQSAILLDEATTMTMATATTTPVSSTAAGAAASSTSLVNGTTMSSSSNNNNNDANSNNSNSINTQIELIENEFQELIQLDDNSVSAIKNFLRCQGLDWNDVKTMWSKTYLARQEDIEHSTIKDVLQQWPKYLNGRGMELVSRTMSVLTSLEFYVIKFFSLFKV